MVDQSSKNIRVGTIITYITQFLSIGISFIYVPIMLGILGQAEYGLYALVQSIISYLQMSEMGIGTTATRYNSKYIAEGNKEGQKTVNGMFLKMYLGIAGVCVAFATVLFFFLDDIYVDYSKESIQLIKTLFVIAVLNLVITFAFQIFNAIIIAYEQYIFLKIITLMQTILGPISMLAVLYLGYRSVGMLCVTTTISLLFGLVQMLFCLKRFKIKFSFRGHNRELFKKIFSFTIFVFINSLATQMMMNSDKVIISIVMTEYAVAVYAIVMQFHTYSYNFANVLSGFYLPRFTKMIAKCGQFTEEILAALISTGRIQVLVAGLIFGGFLSIGRPFIIRWVGVEYVEAYWLTVIILFTEVIGAAQSMFNALMQAMNLHKMRAIISLLISIVKIILTVIMTMQFGLLGCAIAFLAGWLIKQIVFNVYYKKTVGIDVKRFWMTMLKMILPLLFTVVLLHILMSAVQTILPATNYIFIFVYVCLYLVLYGVIMWGASLNAYEKTFIKEIFKKVGKNNEPSN